MCGINGSIGNSENTVLKMNGAIKHRGPDDGGVFANTHFTIGNNRLAIIDLSPLGHQPMTTSDGRYSIVYNGEIYNFKEIKGELELLGVVFKSHSDTEVILEGFAQWGLDITKKLRGMWAFAILDSTKQKLFLARDPFGIKPLYLYDDGKTLAFSSEIKGLLANENIERTINTEAVKNILTLGYPIAPNTILGHTTAILPGEKITIDLNTKKKVSEIQTLETGGNVTPPSDAELEKLLLDSVEHHLIADVPVGLFFSGGTDSTSLAVTLRVLNKKLNVYHVNIKGRKDTEYARNIATHLRLPFKEISLEKENIPKLFEEMIEKMDQPLADSSLLPTMLVSREARKDVAVVLSGEGGDELFAGYTRHQKLSSLPLFSKKPKEPLPWDLLLQKAPILFYGYPQMQGVIRLFASINGDAFEKYYGETGFGRPFDGSGGIPKALRARIKNREHPDGILALDRLVYLPDDLLLKIDTATMAYSLEGRVPFLDREIFKVVGGAPISWKKENGILKAPLKQYLSKHLPKELVERPKTGFSIPLSEFFFKHQRINLRESLKWYKSTYTGLFPALDAVLVWGENREDILIKNIGHSLYAITILHAFSKKL